MDRNPMLDLQAAAAMPGLELIAAVIEEHHPRTRKTRRHPLALALFLVAKGIVPSGNELESKLATAGVWQALSTSAARVGRTLPELPPTASQFDRMIDAGGPALAQALGERLTTIGTDIATAAGMLTGSVEGRLTLPRPANVLLADGTVFEAASDVKLVDGQLHGSRATDPARARVAVKYRGKPDCKTGSGLPFVAASIHGRTRWNRVVLGVVPYRDGNETGAAERLLEQVLAATGPRVEALAYDMLMQPKTFQPLLVKYGTMPIIEIPNRRTGLALDLPPELHIRRGKRVKDKLRYFRLGPVVHASPTGECGHMLWAIDGALAVTPPGVSAPTLDDPLVEPWSVQRHKGPQGFSLLGHYRIPCRHGHIDHTIDFTSGELRGTTDLLNVLRPLAQHDTRWPVVHGWRSDVESLFSTIKKRLPDGRATRFDIDRFWIDVIGFAFAINATCWDVHVAGHTALGAKQGARLARGVKS